MDLDQFLARLEPDAPSGVDLRNETGFLAIERKMAPAARANRRGGEASPADWDGILADAAELAASGRDLRLLVVVARALANTDGFAGAARGLDLLTETVAQFWDSVHPALRDRPDPKDAALRRINALRQLESHDEGMLGDLQLNVVLNVRGVGAVTGDDLAAGMKTPHKVMTEAPSGLGQAEQDALIAAHEDRVNRVRGATRAVASETPERMETLAGDVQAARAAVDRLEQALAAALGASNGQGVRFQALAEFLDEVQATLADAVAYARQAEGSEQGGQQAEAGAAGDRVQGGRPAGVPGSINSRDDVMRALDQIIAFYERTEPASPIPHLAKRMRRMVPMNFMELMAELAPSGVKEFRSAAGLTDDKHK